jgi:hypothetical protein
MWRTRPIKSRARRVTATQVSSVLLSLPAQAILAQEGLVTRSDWDILRGANPSGVMEQDLHPPNKAEQYFINPEWIAVQLFPTLSRRISHAGMPVSRHWDL